MGVALIYVGLLAGIVGFLLLVVPLIVAQGTTITASLTSYYHTFVSFLYESPSRLIRRLAWQLPLELQAAPPPGQNAETFDTVARALRYAGLIGDGLFVLVAVLLLAFYWTLDRERLWRSLLLLAPLDKRNAWREFIGTTEEKVGAYIRGIAVLCTIVGSLALLADRLSGLPHALLLGIAAGLLEAVPMIGPALGAVPAVLVALSVEPAKALWVVAATAVIQFVENTVLVPRVMRRAVGVNPFVTLLALAAFGTLFGLPGAFLAIPLAAIIQMAMNRLFLADPAPERQNPEGRDYASVLRYETQEVVRDVRKQLREKPMPSNDVSDQVEDALEAIANDLDSILARSSQKADEAS
jgi:predicted PurR-regulated permease PerM